ncbi:MAG: hypothetical protein ACRCUY_01230 [Thermoguttaceae bacterium]
MTYKKIKRVYVDTSVIGGNFDAEFNWQTEPFWNAVRSGSVIAIVSDVLENELKRGAPMHIRGFFRDFEEFQIERVASTTESDSLAMRYITEKVVGRSSLEDCKHIALATIHHADCLVSWNFKHIVNFNRIRGYNGVNLLLGYQTLEIRTPYEVINDDEN